LKNPKHPKNERGAVLLTTLLLMTVMAAITLAIVDDIRYSIKRAVNLQAGEQLDLTLRGGEAFAKSWLSTTIVQNPDLINQSIRAATPVVFPLDDEGVMSVVIQDGRNCFNLNYLATPDIQELTRNQFAILLRFLEFDDLEAQTISASVQDWIDQDSIPQQSGAEDLDYTNLTPPYHAANTLMVDITELREIQGIDEFAYQILKPFVCTMNDMKVNILNLNTLTLEQAPLLAMVFGKDEGLLAAEAVIAQRPATGYESVLEVWELDVVENLDMKGAGTEMVSVSTNRVNMLIRIESGEQVRSRAVQFSMNKAGYVVLVSRRSEF